MNCFIQESSSVYQFSYLPQTDMMSESRSCHAVTAQPLSVMWKFETDMFLDKAFAKVRALLFMMGIHIQFKVSRHILLKEKS